MENRIGNQTIKSASWTSTADNIDIGKITTDKQTFKCLISGGTNYHNVGITFKVITSGGETRTFNCVLPILPEGVMAEQTSNTIIIVGSNQSSLGKGEKGDPGESGKDGESYVNDGTSLLDVKALKVADVGHVNLEDVPNGAIALNSFQNQLVIKQNNQWVALNNMSNFEIETTYKNNTGLFPINFAPSAFVASSDAVSGATGLTAGYLSPDTSKVLLTPTTMLIRVDFKIIFYRHNR